METTKVEFDAVSAVADNSRPADTQELHELQLAFVGGGTGDVHFG